MVVKMILEGHNYVFQLQAKQDLYIQFFLDT